ncbi:MAG: OmpH family outer membrane protein [Abditibacteriota bacterium]|nr:OmpH family outer membrane protein [Abditibacteriota bacterium]
MKKIIVTVLLLAFAAAAAVGQTIGKFDEEKVQDTPLFKSLMAELGEADQNVRRELALRTNNPFLTENEVSELISESAKNASGARVKELQDENKKREAEYTTLSQANPPSDEQKKRIDELSQMQKKSAANLENVKESMTKTMEELFMAKQAALDAQIAKACEAVAAEKKLSVIVLKSAVLYGGVDVTEDVLAKLPASL